MSNRLTKFKFTPEENQQIEATIILPKESRSVIHGVVKNHKKCNVENAVVKIFEVAEQGGKNILKPIGHTFTDELGQFLFGPLAPNRHYIVKVWVNDIKIKEMIINPEEDDYLEEKTNLIGKGYYRARSNGSENYAKGGEKEEYYAINDLKEEYYDDDDDDDDEK